MCDKVSPLAHIQVQGLSSRLVFESRLSRVIVAGDFFMNRGFKYEVQRGLKIHEIPDAGF